jgi:tRNA A-37 threonylcarbamoyl transferase component Bud32
MSGIADEPTDALPVQQLLEIDAICARFEAAWKAGQQPKVEDYLDKTSGPQRAELQRELEKVDAEYRLKAKAKALPVSPISPEPRAGAAVQPSKPAAFDPYYQWLGIAQKDQPPNHYRLLGIERSEENPHVIDSAAEQRTTYLRTFQIGKYSELSQRLLNEVAKAKVCLLNPAKKAAYDARLKQQSPSAQAAPPSAPRPPKNQLGEYQLLAKLGSGGMGTVYKARHTKLEKTVALKVLAKGSLANGEATARFEREMKAVGQLNHPNIVQAHDAREIAGTRFLVMEYVDGLNLAQLVDACGPLPVADACELIRQTALGLDHAHQHGLVHRDIKPSNLMLDSQGQVKILDLGLALFQPGQFSGVERITASGQAMGTVDYMAPEQALASRDVDIRADLYSLGCTLYKLLTGRASFSGSKYQDVPAELAAVLDRLLAKDPAGRFATPAEVVAAIAPLAGGSNLRELLARAGNVPARPTKAAASGTHAETLSNVASQAQSVTRPRLNLAGWVPPRFRSPGWLAVAAGGAAAVVLLTVVILLRKDGKQTRIEAPDGSKVTISAKGDVDVTLPKEEGTEAQRHKGTEAQRHKGTEKSGKQRADKQQVGSSGTPVLTTAVSPESAGRGAPGLWPTVAPSPPIPSPQSPAPPPAVAPFVGKKAKEDSEKVGGMPDLRAGPARSASGMSSGKVAPFLLGYGLETDASRCIPEVASYTNFVWDYSWETSADANEMVLRAIEMARKERLALVVSIGDKRKMDRFLEVGLDVLKANRDVVFAVAVSCPQLFHVKPAEVAAFGAEVKRASPGIQFWICLLDTKFDIPSTVDTVVLDWIGCATPQEAQRRAEKVLPRQLAKAAGRPVVLAWDCWEGKGSGLVPKCQPDTLREFGEIAKKQRLAGLIFSSYASAKYLGRNFAGLQTRPELVAEIKGIARDRGVTGDKSPPGRQVDAAVPSAKLEPSGPGITRNGREEEVVEEVKKLGGRALKQPVFRLFLENSRATDATLELFTGLDRLEGLYLDDTAVSDAGLKHLQGLPQLRNLYLNNTRVTDAGLACLITLPNLRVLFLNGTKISDKGLEHLKGATQLQRLGLERTGATDATLELFTGLDRLEGLYLDDTAVSDAGLKHLQGLPQLRYLYLGNTRVTDAGLACLKTLPSLRMLFLNGTTISDNGLEHLKGATRLQRIGLERTRVTEVGIKRLQQTLPDCKIFVTGR